MNNRNIKPPPIPRPTGKSSPSGRSIHSSNSSSSKKNSVNNITRFNRPRPPPRPPGIPRTKPPRLPSSMGSNSQRRSRRKPPGVMGVKKSGSFSVGSDVVNSRRHLRPPPPRFQGNDGGGRAGGRKKKRVVVDNIHQNTSAGSFGVGEDGNFKKERRKPQHMQHMSLLGSMDVDFSKLSSVCEGNLALRTKGGIKGKWTDYYVRLGVDKILKFSIDQEAPTHALEFDLMNATIKKKQGLKMEITLVQPIAQKILLKAPTNILYERWLKYLGLPDTNKKDKMGYFVEFTKNRFSGGIFSKHFPVWSQDEVLNWLGHIKIGYDETMNDKYGQIFKSRKINGEMLRDCFINENENLDKVLTVMGMKDELHRNIFKYELSLIEKSGKFDVAPFIVQNKVQKMLLKHAPGKKDQKKINKPFPEFMDYCTNFHVKRKMFKTIKWLLTKNEKVKKGEKTFKVKFIITESVQDWKMQQVRKIIGTPLSIVNRMGLTDIKFGMFHAAFSIGPLQVEWVDNSLCLLRSISSENVLLCVDVGYYTTKNVEIFAMSLAEMCRRWNRDYSYTQLNLKNKKYHANCQQFVEFFIVGHLGLRLDFSAEIKSYLQKISERGDTKMMFTYNEDFAKKFALEPESSPFCPKNHVELDDFVELLLNMEPNFEQEYPAKYELLKGFDRAFWMRHLNQMKQLGKKTIDFTSLHSPSTRGCPFNSKDEKDVFEL